MLVIIVFIIISSIVLFLLLLLLSLNDIFAASMNHEVIPFSCAHERFTNRGRFLHCNPSFPLNWSFLVMTILTLSSFFAFYAEYIYCEGLADVVFLVDLSVSFKDYNHQLFFIKRLARRLNISPEFSRAAVVLYSVFGDIVVNLNDNPTFRQFERAIDRLRYRKGERRIVDRALCTVWRKVFTEQNGARKYAPKVCVCLLSCLLACVLVCLLACLFTGDCLFVCFSLSF